MALQLLAPCCPVPMRVSGAEVAPCHEAGKARFPPQSHPWCQNLQETTGAREEGRNYSWCWWRGCCWVSRTQILTPGIVCLGLCCPASCPQGPPSPLACWPPQTMVHRAGGGALGRGSCLLLRPLASLKPDPVFSEPWHGGGGGQGSLAAQCQWEPKKLGDMSGKPLKCLSGSEVQTMSSSPQGRHGVPRSCSAAAGATPGMGITSSTGAREPFP